MVTIVEQLQQNFHEKFLSENILSHYFLSEMFFRALKWNFLAIRFILLAGHDCWKSFLKLQLYRAFLSSCPAKNSQEISFCHWSVKTFQFLFSTCLVKIVEGKLSERPDYNILISFLISRPLNMVYCYYDLKKKIKTKRSPSSI